MTVKDVDVIVYIWCGQRRLFRATSYVNKSVEATLKVISCLAQAEFQTKLLLILKSVLNYIKGNFWVLEVKKDAFRN